MSCHVVWCGVVWCGVVWCTNTPIVYRCVYHIVISKTAPSWRTWPVALVWDWAPSRPQASIIIIIIILILNGIVYDIFCACVQNVYVWQIKCIDRLCGHYAIISQTLTTSTHQHNNTLTHTFASSRESKEPVWLMSASKNMSSIVDSNASLLNRFSLSVCVMSILCGVRKDKE